MICPTKTVMILHPIHRSRQHRARSIPAKLSELVFQMLSGFIRDVPDFALGLEIGDELCGTASPGFPRMSGRIPPTT
jgi:hypothetical protein